jgi:ECF sigma factor
LRSSKIVVRPERGGRYPGDDIVRPFPSRPAKLLGRTTAIESERTDVTRILNALELGQPQASRELLPLVYTELRRLAAQRLARERGQSRDDPPPDDAARAKLREQAFSWLKAELSAWQQFLKTADSGNNELVAKTLNHWKTDTDLAGIRDEPGLWRLPVEERTALEEFWREVNRLVTRAGCPSQFAR